MNSRSTTRSRRVAAAALIALVGILLTACTSTGATPSTNDSSVKLQDLGHIHGLAIDDQGAGMIASHSGLYNLDASDDAMKITGPIGDSRFDVMGFSATPDALYASGHPSAASPDHLTGPNLGLIVSMDRGETWQNVALAGQVDFHVMTAHATDQETLIYGIGPGSRVLASRDGGETWTQGAAIQASSLAVDPIDPEMIYATTEGGLAVSKDNGVTFSVDTDAPILVQLITQPEGRYAGFDIEGRLWSKDSGSEWQSGPDLPPGSHLMATSPSGSMLLAADTSGAVHLSRDGGQAWSSLEQ